MKPHQSGQREQCGEEEQRVREGTAGSIEAHPPEKAPHHPEHAAEHGRYTTPTDNIRRRHGLLPPHMGLIYRIMMAYGGVPHMCGELIHRSAWNRISAHFAFWAFSEVPNGLRPGVVGCSLAIKIGGDHGLLQRRTTAPAYQRASAQADRHGLARAAGR